MGLISELRRRNVFRMAVLYVVAAWAVMQVAEVFIGLANLPEWLGPVLLAVLAIGFPIALIFSWFYEITPEGLALEKDVDRSESITHATGRRMDFIVIAMLLAGLLVFAYDKWWPEGPIERSIAVLAFDNMSGDPGEEYLSDGISEEILNLLAQLRPLKVIARQSSFSFKGRNVDIATIARQLNVGWVLEGSVRRHEDRIRVTAQLIDATDSTRVWSRTYDRDLSASDLLYLQSEIARAVARELQMTLTGEDNERLAKVPTDNTEAYAAYLLGRQRLTDRKVTELDEAVRQFARAIELDPGFAGAYSGLVDACFLYDIYSGGHAHSSCPGEGASGADRHDPQALLELAHKAVELDGDLGEAWVSLGMMLHETSEDFDDVKEAKAAFERGLALNPAHAQGYNWYADTLMYPELYGGSLNDWLQAWKDGAWQSVIKQGLEVDPLSIHLHYRMASYPIFARSEEEAFWHARRMIEIAPDSPRGYERMGELSWELSGRLDEAIKWETKCTEIDPHHPPYSLTIGRAYAALGDREMAFAYLERARRLAPTDKRINELVAISEVLAWLVRGDGQSMQKARELLDKLEQGGDQYVDEQRHEIEASLAIASGQAPKWLAEFGKEDDACIGAEIDEAYVDNCPNWLDRVLQESGREERARTATEKRLEVEQIWYDEWPGKEVKGFFARHYAMLGRIKDALDDLETMIRSGWRGSYYHHDTGVRFMLYHDATLDAVRDHPRFQSLVAEVEADLAQQLENVREMERKGELPTLKELRRQLGENAR